jgi:hypothetical protein
MKTTEIKLGNGSSMKFDEGASWIHGSGNSNPITKLSKQVPNLVTKNTDFESIEIFTEDG